MAKEKESETTKPQNCHTETTKQQPRLPSRASRTGATFSQILGAFNQDLQEAWHHVGSDACAFNSSDDVLAPLAARGMSSSAFCA